MSSLILAQQGKTNFIMAKVWEYLRKRRPGVQWHKAVWFQGSFMSWLVYSRLAYQ